MGLKKAKTLDNVGATFPNAYSRVLTVNTTKDRIDVVMVTYVDKAARDANLAGVDQKEYNFEFAANEAGMTKNPIAWAYDQLKTHEDYTGSEDV